MRGGRGEGSPAGALHSGEGARLEALLMVAVFAAAAPSLRSGAPPAEPPAPSCGAEVVRGAGGLRCADAPVRGVRGLWLGRALDLDRASALDLSIVPGIGPALSGRLVEARRRFGGFRTPEDLERVRGVGPRLRGRLLEFGRLPSPSVDRAAAER